MVKNGTFLKQSTNLAVGPNGVEVEFGGIGELTYRVRWKEISLSTYPDYFSNLEFTTQIYLPSAPNWKHAGPLNSTEVEDLKSNIAEALKSFNSLVEFKTAAISNVQEGLCK